MAPDKSENITIRPVRRTNTRIAPDNLQTGKDIVKEPIKYDAYGNNKETYPLYL
jgi:hypothetical protein